MRFGLPVAIVATLLIFASLWALMHDHAEIPRGDIEFFCAMGVNEPMKKILKDYEQRYGVRVNVVYDGSKKLFNPMKVSGRADLYLAADESYMEDAEAANIDIRETLPIAYQRPVIVLRKDSPLDVQSIDDLQQDGVRLYLANPEHAAISKVVRSRLGDERWNALWQRILTAPDTVTSVANYVAMEHKGAGIIWDANVAQYPDLRIVRVPEFETETNQITIAVLGSSTDPTNALHLARFIAARDEGLKVFADAGYEVAEGDLWSDQPEITLFGGGLNREAVFDTLKEFGHREGVKINHVFDGCGALVGRMDPNGLAEQPDIYFACATSYMDKVSDLFWAPVDVSGTDLVIAVPHGATGIAQLADLAQPGIKVGLCDAEISALGALSLNLLKALPGVLEGVEKNARDYPGTAPALVAKVATGALDAAVVYRANATAMQRAGKLDIIEIDDVDAHARQPIAIGRFSNHRQLCQRLVEAILAAESRDRFEALGFRWYGGDASR